MKKIEKKENKSSTSASKNSIKKTSKEKETKDSKKNPSGTTVNPPWSSFGQEQEKDYVEDYGL